MEKFNCIVVLGPTASGKTRLACQLAYNLNGEIISADSRQVYQHLDIGTGKDLQEYFVNRQEIVRHLIDIVYPAEQFYLHQFVQGLKESFDKITNEKKVPIICGGTGLYLDALRKDFSLTQVPENVTLRETLMNLSKEELLKRLTSYPADSVRQVDINSKKRIIRGIEIAEYFKTTMKTAKRRDLPYQPYYIGIRVDLETRKKFISQRLAQRIENGLIGEVEGLLEMGISPERLMHFGLEYKFVLLYLQKEISKEELFTRLETAIFQFAKRQMTWFRKMEREGVEIHWVNKDENIKKLLQDLEGISVRNIRH